MKFTWSQFQKAKEPTTVGPFIVVDLPLLGIEGIDAKVDTGAFSGALHASNIREVSDADGVKHLHFNPLASKDHTLEVDHYHRRSVKSSNGQSSLRYAFDTEVEILGQRYPLTITLSNRSSMKYQMLIGRKFLQTHGFLVDVSINSK